MSHRFDRLSVLPEIGEEGIARLETARIAVVGLGGLGCPVASYLGAAGVGHLTLIDDGVIALPDLGRQFLYGPPDVGRNKVEVANARLTSQNPCLGSTERTTRIGLDNALSELCGHDLIVDCTDSLGSRRLVNMVAVEMAIPVVFGGAVGWSGFVQTFVPGSPCFDCVWTDRTMCGACGDVGVSGPIVGAIGSLQACEALKLVLGVGNALAGRLILLDGLAATCRTLDVRRRSDCQACSR